MRFHALAAGKLACAVLLPLLSGCERLIPPIDPVRVGSVSDPGVFHDTPSLMATSMSGALSTDVSKGADPGAGVQPENTFFRLYAKSINDAKNAQTAEMYMEMGFALSDQLCSEWFEKLGQAQVRDAATKDLVGNVGALTAVLMGVSQASADSITAVAAGTNFAQRSIDSATANYIVAPDIGVVKRLIVVERSLVADEAKAKLKNTTDESKFAIATQLLIGYDNLCSHIEVKRVVNESVAANANIAVDKSTKPSEFYAALLSVAIQKLKTLFASTALVDESGVVALYGLEMVPDKLTDGAKTAFTKLAADQKLTVAPADEAKAKSILSDANMFGDLDKKLASGNSLKSAGGAPAPAPTPVPAPQATESRVIVSPISPEAGASIFSK